ncbi:hypothetical protein SDC9_181499 [bioreactor metagenome]|uniref:Uncharacterized protein n=1 Tax=bioreactor metagenome TaxID=1076179 RepID=A0A645H4S2_9ZZZZ
MGSIREQRKKRILGCHEKHTISLRFERGRKHVARIEQIGCGESAGRHNIFNQDLIAGSIHGIHPQPSRQQDHQLAAQRVLPGHCIVFPNGVHRVIQFLHKRIFQIQRQVIE